MKSFLIKILKFIAPILLIGFGMEIYLRNIPNDYKYKREYVENNSGNIKTLILGSSHAYRGIDPKYLRENAYNLSFIGQTLDYDYLLFNKYKESLKNLKNLIIPISYFTYYNELKEGVEPWRVKNYAIYYGIEPDFSVINHSEILTNRIKVNVSRIISSLKGENEITTDNLGFGPFEEKSLKNLNFKSNGKSAAIRHSKLNNDNIKKHINYLNEIIKYCESNEIKVILVTTPVYKTYRENIIKEQLQETFFISDSISSVNENTIYLNEFFNPIFKKEDFYNSDHLNSSGAKKLSVIIEKYLK